MMSPEIPGAEIIKIGKVACAWCGRELGEKEGLTGTSHGVCLDCRAMMEESVGPEIPRERWEEAVRAVELIRNPYLEKPKILKLLLDRYQRLVAAYLGLKLDQSFPLDQLPELADQLVERFKIVY